MLAVVQRVKQSSVEVDEQMVGSIKNGLNVLLGVCKGDTKKDAQVLADKIVNLRCFEDKNNKMNLSLLDVEGEILSIPQFTLCADCSKGRRPSFNPAASPGKAEKLYQHFNNCLQKQDLKLATGQFGAFMQVEISNDGPVTFVLDSNDLIN
ncbi:MAG TPA: D-aminoacyl-tRNA deacylase [bacterium]|nr:D-aminoacyl-tRNA deacylase [bacterium]